jgi:predicted metal-dependent phosphotriesterase family hydrolase
MSEFSSDPTRREALARGLRLLSAGVVAGAAFPHSASAQTPAFPKGAVIRTLFKDYAPEELAGGATVFHEHVHLGTDFGDKFRAATNAVRALNGLPPQPAPPPAPAAPDPRRDPKLMAEELNAAKRDGIACLVDAGHPDMGRDITFARQAAMLSSLPVVAGAGFYSQPYYPQEISTMSEEQIVRALVQQVDDFPAGVFGEIGSWDEMTKDERKVFRAIGKAQVATNLPILTHTGIPGKAAIEQLDILEDAGVNPNRVVIGHLGNLVDPNVYVHKTICRRGAFVGFDRQGGPNDAQQVPLVMALLEAGFADNLLFSADQSSGFGRTLTAFVPKLKAAGASDAVLRQIMVDNPRRFLAFVPKRPRKR